MSANTLKETMNWRRAVVSSRLPSNSKLLLLILGLRLNQYGDGACYPSRKTLMAEMSVGEKTLDKHVRICVAQGWLVKLSRQDRSGRSTSNEWIVTIPGGEGANITPLAIPTRVEGSEKGGVTTLSGVSMNGESALTLGLDEGPDPRIAQFEKLWQVDRRGSKDDALVQFKKAVPSRVRFEVLYKARQQVNEAAGGREFVPFLAGWISKSRWTEELAMPEGPKDEYDPLAEIKRIEEAEYD